MNNPKAEPTDNPKRDPDEWLSGHDPMTCAQASYLKTLCEQAGTPEVFNENKSGGFKADRCDAPNGRGRIMRPPDQSRQKRSSG